jgi:prepilin-type N-terminal cleavage/methylation domain-containing protein
MLLKRKGFTLIELLIVIGILAILATVTILVLNPAQLFAESRDSQRISDLGTLNQALGLYLASIGTTPDMDAGGGVCGTNYWSTITGSSESFTGSPTLDASHGAEVDGTGWIPIDFTALSAGSPVAALPLDPSNTTALNYQYQCNDTAKTYELNAIMESTRFASGGGDDVEGTDGGDNGDVYEIGTDPGLNL